MNLVTSTDKVTLTTSGTSAIDVHATWFDLHADRRTPGRQNTLITTATTTDIVTSPAAQKPVTARAIEEISIRNDGGAANTVTVKHTDGTNAVDLLSVTLAAGESLKYWHGRWARYDGGMHQW